jgi:elongation factor Ts
MNITTERIKELRDQTGISIMQCRKALEEAQGDMEKAVIILQKQSKAVASKKSDRTLKAGTVASYIHATGTIGAMVELFCETDFVGKNDEFRSVARDIALHIAATNPEFLKKEDISEDMRLKVQEIFADEVKSLPEAIRAKALEGKMDAYFSERILLDQLFVKDQNITVREIIDGAVQKFGERIEIGRFARFGISR